MQPNGEINVQEAIGAIKSTKLNIRSIKYVPGEKIDESNFQNKKNKKKYPDDQIEIFQT
jgi:hypothetical protein